MCVILHLEVDSAQIHPGPVVGMAGWREELRASLAEHAAIAAVIDLQNWLDKR